jgi:hypothetical protein
VKIKFDKCVSEIDLDAGLVAERFKDKIVSSLNEPLKGKIDFGPKSLMRIGLKQFIGTFMVPMLEDLYAFKHYPPPRIKTRHEPVIDYFLEILVKWVSLAQEDTEVDVAIQNTEGGRDRVATLSTSQLEKGGGTGTGTDNQVAKD